MEKLKKFKIEVDREIAAYLDRTIAGVAKKDRVMAQALRYVKKMVLAQGKRIRPAMMYYGYLAAGGRDRKRMIRTAVSIELVHIFLLVHDDIIDRGDKRHGVKTVHLWFRDIGKRLFPKKDADHFGNSMAIVVGDTVGALGNQIIYHSGFSPERVVAALHKLQDIIALTVVGEGKDIYIEYQGKASEAEILRMYEYKTAKYTFEGPLHLGAILGGGKDSLLKNLSAYAVPLGVAFQIQDDILGIFGNEMKLGKSTASDIEEGKQTVLVARALKNGSGKQKKQLLAILGKKNLSVSEIREFQDIVRETGALDYAQRMAKNLIAESQAALEKAEMKKEAKKFLLEVAEHMVNREV